MSTFNGSPNRIVGLAVIGIVMNIVTACLVKAQVEGKTTAVNVAASTTASRKLPNIGMSLYRLEREAYTAASESPFFQDPEDAQTARAEFFQSSLKVLTLATAADSTNASAWYHLGTVTAAKSYQGFGTWDIDLVRMAISQLEIAESRATRAYRSIRPSIRKALGEQRKIIASIH
jgi:hypothetical protein